MSAFTAGAELQNGRKVAPDELHTTMLESISMQ